MTYLTPPRSLRDFRGDTSRADLAGLIGCSVHALRAWEKEERRMPAPQIDAAAKALRLSDADAFALFQWASSVTPAARADGGAS